MTPHERIADLEKDRHQLGEQLQQVLVERDAYRRWKCDADAEIADLKRQLAEARECADRWGEWRDKAESYERQLVCISKVLGGKDARHVREGFEPSIAGLVEQQLTALREQNAKLREASTKAVSSLKRALEHTRPPHGIQRLRAVMIAGELQSALRETSDESEAKDDS